LVLNLIEFQISRLIDCSGEFTVSLNISTNEIDKSKLNYTIQNLLIPKEVLPQQWCSDSCDELTVGVKIAVMPQHVLSCYLSGLPLLGGQYSSFRDFG